jgi:hypothetical protein
MLSKKDYRTDTWGCSMPLSTKTKTKTKTRQRLYLRIIG